ANEGSVAAPTASLHFTPQLMEAIRAVGCGVEFVTLHLGTASFLPLWNEGEEAAVEPTRPGREHGFFDTRLLSKIEETKARGGRVIAVGTSVVRLLETVARRESNGSGVQHFASDLFIEPGFEFRYVDAMVTNFHQPRTTHLLLVQAFMGRDLLARSYEFALGHEFRFLSYGDGMLIL
ncbi:MAG: S-adenosylmethionine:tRNA ribosyltransferase-isomerase, partial [Deltaproteobacteria bacterium]|nr:S-adenosylmethionine:tRNA ribosyltransferase-isomerase [Deltaproteobacteria bacterium]